MRKAERSRQDSLYRSAQNGKPHIFFLKKWGDVLKGAAERAVFVGDG